MGVRPRRWSSTRRRPFTAANGTRMYTYVVLSLRSDARSATPWLEVLKLPVIRCPVRTWIWSSTSILISRISSRETFQKCLQNSGHGRR